MLPAVYLTFRIVCSHGIWSVVHVFGRVSFIVFTLKPAPNRGAHRSWNE